MRTELVFILDRSGSMGGLESDTIGGFNSMLKKQQAEDGECNLTTVLFDNEYEILHDRLDIKAINPMTDKEYSVRGTTALLDAIGKTINKIVNVQKQCKPEYKADKVLFVITTDGMENASREFDNAKIKSMIERQKKEYNWEFIFLGANIDAVEVADNFGIDKKYAKNFHNDSQGISKNYESVGTAISNWRTTSMETSLSDDWGDEIDKDYNNRGNNENIVNAVKNKPK